MDSHLRSVAKAISWRVTGSIDTMVLSFLFTRSFRLAAAIGLTEVMTKSLLYYLHERAWVRVPFGQGDRPTHPVGHETEERIEPAGAEAVDHAALPCPAPPLMAFTNTPAAIRKCRKPSSTCRF